MFSYLELKKLLELNKDKLFFFIEQCDINHNFLQQNSFEILRISINNYLETLLKNENLYIAFDEILEMINVNCDFDFQIQINEILKNEEKIVEAFKEKKEKPKKGLLAIILAIIFEAVLLLAKKIKSFFSSKNTKKEIKEDKEIDIIKVIEILKIIKELKTYLKENW